MWMATGKEKPAVCHANCLFVPQSPSALFALLCFVGSLTAASQALWPLTPRFHNPDLQLSEQTVWPNFFLSCQEKR